MTPSSVPGASSSLESFASRTESDVSCGHQLLHRAQPPQGRPRHQRGSRCGLIAPQLPVLRAETGPNRTAGSRGKGRPGVPGTGRKRASPGGPAHRKQLGEGAEGARPAQLWGLGPAPPFKPVTERPQDFRAFRPERPQGREAPAEPR